MIKKKGFSAPDGAPPKRQLLKTRGRVKYESVRGTNSSQRKGMKLQSTSNKRGECSLRSGQEPTAENRDEGA